MLRVVLILCSILSNSVFANKDCEIYGPVDFGSHGKIVKIEALNNNSESKPMYSVTFPDKFEGYKLLDVGLVIGTLKDTKLHTFLSTEKIGFKIRTYLTIEESLKVETLVIGRYENCRTLIVGLQADS